MMAQVNMTLTPALRERVSSIVCGFFAVIALAIIVLVCWGSFRLAQQERRAEDRLNAFLAECIELHSESRCKEFWRYNRIDLGRK